MRKIPAVILLLFAVILSSCGNKASKDTGTISYGNYTYRGGIEGGRYSGYGVLTAGDSVVYEGQWKNGKRHGYGITYDDSGRKVTGLWNADTLVNGIVKDSLGTYYGELDNRFAPRGHGVYYGSDGSFYDGNWDNGMRNHFGCAVGANGKVMTGEWKDNKYRGEIIRHNAERIYGIDISRYQHGKGKKKYPIYWDRLRITGLGKISRKEISGKVDYPVSFVYIKSTEGTTVRNPYYASDYNHARRNGIPCGAYHFFSPFSPAARQARHFLKHSRFRRGDFPPVLDVEPTEAHIRKMGGAEAMFKGIRTWLNIVQRQVGVRPILYVSQQFVNKYLPMAPDIMRDYMIWIARYGEYKPDVKLVFWQLSPDGQVEGIKGDVDINVFNGYHDKFNEFLQNERIKF